jgi:hypothetical protein
LHRVQAVIAEVSAALEEAEERAAQLPADSPDGEDARDRAERLRELYEELTAGGITHEVAAAAFTELRREATT